MAFPSNAPPRPDAKSDVRRLTIIPLLGADDDGRAKRTGFAAAVARGLLGSPKTLPCQYFYDDLGSALFDEICRLPEYYLTRTEDAILRESATEMVDLGSSSALTLIELGSGSAEKTRRLIDAASVTHGRVHYAPIDVSAAPVRASAKELIADYPGLKVTGFVADYHEHLKEIAARFTGPKLFAFLGSSLGNYENAAAADLLTGVARAMGPGDRLLLGTDMAKSAEVLEPAYDDAQGVTARFNRNVLVRINRELGADFAPERFDHQAIYRPERGRVEIHLVSRTDQAVTIPAASLTVGFAAGESIHTENSHKYTTETLAAIARRSGFVEERAWTDPRGWFRVQRWRASARG